MENGAETDQVSTQRSSPSPASGSAQPATGSCPVAEVPAECCVHELFETQTAEKPASVAAVFGDRQLTYGELNARANQLAHLLRKRGIGPESIVALRFERSLEMIVGILGVLKAGGAYLPVDPSYPVERQQFMLQDARVPLVISQRQLPTLDHSADIFYLDPQSPELDREPKSNLVPKASSANLAYVIYTSGSTGRPKGVPVTHRNLVHSTAARFEYYPEAVGNYLLLSSYSFDSSVAGIFWTLCQGGTLILPPEYSQQKASELAELIARHRVSHLLSLPSLYAVLLDQPDLLATLRTAIVAGEACPISLVKRHYESLPRTTLYNEYGPTETTVWATVHRCRPKEQGRVPIGKAIPNTSLHILNEQLQPVAEGQSGELYIGGPGVVRGYLNRPELTAARFISDPFSADSRARLYKTGDRVRRLSDGTLDFLGRVDHQIKIRGHRIEPEEIESALKQNESVRDVIVIAQGVENEGERSRPVSDGEDTEQMAQELMALSLAEAEAILAEVEGHASEIQQRKQSTSEFEIGLQINRRAFINPPRESQRNWLLNRAVAEFSEDLSTLDSLAARFVSGAPVDAEMFVQDRTQAALEEQEILEDWHIPLMRAMARGAAESHGDVLEIGFGRGVASTFLQECGLRSHTIIECNDSIIERFFQPWRDRFKERDIRLARGKWQDVIGSLGQFDGIFFQTYPLNEQEFTEHLSNSITFAEHFFPIAARHLRPGGAFTYLTHEIDSLSRRHQRLIFRHFNSMALSVEPLKVPENTRDLWWADSMVVVKAIK